MFSKSPDLLFFSLLVGAATLGDCFEISFGLSWSAKFVLLCAGIALITLIATALYGMLIFSTVVESPVMHTFRAKLVIISPVIAGAMALASLVAQVRVARFEEKKEDQSWTMP